MYFGSYQGVYFGSYYDQSGVVPPVEQKFQGAGFHSWKYEQQLLEKALREAKEARADIEANESKIIALEAEETEIKQQLKAAPRTEKKELRDDLTSIINEIALLRESLLIAIDLHSHLMKRIQIHRNNMNILIIAAACPFNKINLN